MGDNEGTAFIAGAFIALVFVFVLNKCTSNGDLRDCLKEKWVKVEECKDVYGSK